MKHGVDINFRSIRSARGSQHAGFEELCVSLFREEVGDPFAVVRVEGSGGDGGVEAYYQRGPRAMVGLQAKYFERLGPSQWAQIRKSIEQARINHPLLRIYYVASPLDLTPAATKAWSKIQIAVKAMRPALTLVWWGASALTHRLTQASHAGRLSYWFGMPRFSRSWLDHHSQQARADLDTRYTPEKHVRVAIQDALSAFSHDRSFFARYYGRARDIWKAVREVVDHLPPHEYGEELSMPFRMMESTSRRHLTRLGDGKNAPLWSEAKDAIKTIRSALADLGSVVHAIVERPTGHLAGPPHPSPLERVRSLSHDCTKASQQLYEFSRFLDDSVPMDRRRLLVTGEAGAGKSHLLASFVEELRDRGQCALLLLGEYFTGSDNPWSQFVAKLGWEGSAEDLIASLNYEGEIHQAPAIIVIDALNETPERDVWLSHLNAFAARLDKWPWVRLIVSCRSDFVPICLPGALAERRDGAWAYADHRGFGEAVFDATARYFAAYRVKAKDLPPLLSEFTNPLFLKTFCEAFENSTVPSGAITLELVMSRRVGVASKQIERSIDCPPDVTWSGLTTLAKAIADYDWKPVPLAKARAAIDALFPGRGRSRSLFEHLSSSGLIMQVGHFDYQTRTSDVRVRFAYERFSDYFVAARMLEGVNSVDDLRRTWTSNGYLEQWNSPHGYSAQRGILKALAIMLPGRLRVELAELINDTDTRRVVLQDFLDSLPWRDRTSFSGISEELFNEAASKAVSEVVILRLLIRLATVVDHPWNAASISDWLGPLPLWRRDLHWTIPVSGMMAEEGESSLPTTFVRWLLGVEPSMLSEEQAYLAATLLCWFFSSNDRGFRRRVTLASIHILQHRPDLAARLVEQFYDVNDPYIVERVLAMAAGVAVRQRDSLALSKLAEAVWRRVFKPKFVRPHILLRDYAFTILECARLHGCLPPGVGEDDYQPPYRSRWPRIWSEQKSREFGKKDGWETIIYSIEPEFGNGMGGYGDFGRYTMEAHIHRWSNTPRVEPQPGKDERRGFDSLVARAWVLQRVASLGWSPKRFGRYESNLRDVRRASVSDETRQERISKKYQWIALHELEALISDHYHFGGRWAGDAKSYQGAWQLFTRDFDPGQPLGDFVEIEAEDSTTRDDSVVSPWWVQHPDPFRDQELLARRSAWVKAMPDDPKSLLHLDFAPDIDGSSLALNGWVNWDEPDPYPPRERGMGRCHCYVHFRSWLVRNQDAPSSLQFLNKTHFWGDGVQLLEFGSEGLGEYPWASRFEALRAECENEDRWGEEFPPGFMHTVCAYLRAGRAGSVPSPQLADLLGLKWSGKDYEFIDPGGCLVAFAPLSPASTYAPPCIVNRQRMEQMLVQNELTLMWGIVGERYCFDYDTHVSAADSMVTFSGVYSLGGGVIRGGITQRRVKKVATRRAGHHPEGRRKRNSD